MDDWFQKGDEPENFDPTWPYNFKWGVDGRTNTPHVWRVPVGTDGQDIHREELKELFKRDPRVGAGDDLGVATYVPAERKLGGEIVAPPTVIIHTYFGRETPPVLFDWFEEHFPGVAVRNAWTGPFKKAAAKKATLELCFCDKDPSGHVRGIDCKPEEAKPDHFQTDPKEYYRDTARLGRWVRNTFGTQPGRFKQFTSWFKTGGADKDGAMVAFYIPSNVGEKILVKDGEPLEDLHVTLAYFVDAADDRDDWDDAKKIVEQHAAQHLSFSGKIQGYGTFATDEGMVLWASPDIPGLHEFRHELVEALEDGGFPVSKEHDFVPHVTLKYDHKGALPELEKALEMDLDAIYLVVKEDQTEFEFEGSGFVKNL